MKKGHSGKSYHVQKKQRRKKKQRKEARKIKDPLLRALGLALVED